MTHDYGAIYFTINPVNPDLLARANNRFVESRTATSDADIVCRRWLFIDLDPKRPSGISSSDAELDAARSMADEIDQHLREHATKVLSETGTPCARYTFCTSEMR